MSIVKLLQQGGVFMVPLLFMSILAFSVVIERALHYHGLEWGGQPFQDRLRAYLRQGRIEEALLWLSGMRGAVSQVARAGLSQWDRPRADVEHAMVARSHVEQVQLVRYLGVLETTVTASPLIGLLGTITGMMGVFRAVAEKMAQSPQADTSGILAGIGEALVATATGILVAVGCLICYNVLQSLAESQLETAQTVSDEILALHGEFHG